MRPGLYLNGASVSAYDFRADPEPQALIIVERPRARPSFSPARQHERERLTVDSTFKSPAIPSVSSKENRGTGKTTIAMQFLMEGGRRGQRVTTTAKYRD